MKQRIHTSTVLNASQKVWCRRLGCAVFCASHTRRLRLRQHKLPESLGVQAVAAGGFPKHGQGPRQSALRAAREQAVESSFGSTSEILAVAYGLGMTFDGEKILFDGLTFNISRGQKLAVVGSNGSGKSTLLRIIAGTEREFAGNWVPMDAVRVSYLSQDPQLPENATVLEAVLNSDAPVAKAVRQYRAAMANATADTISKELQDAIEEMDKYEGMAYGLDGQAQRLLEAVGIKNPAARISQLSGGQRKRVALASALLGKPDLLVMDEPTNHMDVDIIAWLEKELAQEWVTLVLVTHDRLFMESVCTQLLELDSGQGVVHNFGGIGSWEQLKEARAARRLAWRREAERAITKLRTEEEWMRKQPKARQAKSMARQQSYYKLKEKAADMPKADVTADLEAAMGQMTRQGSKVLVMNNVSFSLGQRPILKGFSCDFAPGERIGIVGPNGAGKSTLLDLICGVRQPAGGLRVPGDTTVVGYFTQFPPDIRPDMRLIDYIKDVADTTVAARRDGWQSELAPEVLLERLGFSRPRQYQKVESLSGGERRRLHLASVLVGRPNLLVLDEPTNDLDLATIEQLELVLDSYAGTLLVVSHDRSFMDNVTDSLLVLKGDGTVTPFDGLYTQYLAERDQERALQSPAASNGHQASSSSPAEPRQAAQASVAPAPTASPQTERAVAGPAAPSSSAPASSSANGSSAASAAAAGKAPQKRRLGFYEQQEYKRLEKEIDVWSVKKKQVETRMEQHMRNKDYKAMEQATVEVAKLQAELDEKESRWLELAELSDGA